MSQPTRTECTHPDGWVAYPGEITVDRHGQVRDDDMRLVCDDCGTVTTHTD